MGTQLKLEYRKNSQKLLDPLDLYQSLDEYMKRKISINLCSSLLRPLYMLFAEHPSYV